MRKLRRFSRQYGLGLARFLILFSAIFLCGCGGGGSTTSTGPQPSADFSFSANPLDISIVEGSSTSISLSASAVNGFSAPIAVQVSGLPAGISISPASITLTAGTPLHLTLSASAGALSSTGAVSFTATSGSLTHTQQLRLNVFAALSNVPPSRTRYLRTDAETLYIAWLNTHWIVYNSAVSRFFMTDPQGNHVFAIDAATEQKIAAISIPGAFGIDETPDQKTLYVGTLIGDVYTIDAASMTVTHRYVASQIGPFGYSTFTALVLSDGRLALLGAQGGIPSVDGSQSFAVWNPDDNSIEIYASARGPFGPGDMPIVPVCGGFMGNIGGFALTADRTQVIIGSIDSDTTLCEVNAKTGQDNFVQALGSFSTTKIITSPDGNFIALRGDSGQVNLYNAHTLNLAAQLNTSTTLSSASGLVFSADSRRLYILTDSIIYAYDIASGQPVGWSPTIYVTPYFTGAVFTVGPVSPDLEAVDGTSLFAGPMDEGIGLVDLGSLNTGPVGTQFSNAYLNPANGPVSGGTQAGWSAPVIGVKDIYFGGQKAPLISKTGPYFMEVTTPPGLPGPVDVYEYANDGGIQYIPEGFSYGPAILQVTPDASTADGGGTGFIYGYGFVSVTATSLPADLQVSIAGKPASIVGFNPNAYNLLAPPFLLQMIAYTIPPDTRGNVDVTVANSTGSVTSGAALNYVPPVQPFPLAGASLAQGIYDPHRDLYYFTDATKVQVFSKSQGMWLTPFNIPSPLGATHRLWALALSPDGSKLAISDILAGVIYVLNPATPASVQTFPISLPSVPGVVENPAGLAVSDAGVVYYTTFVQGGTGYGSYFKLNTNTGAITDYHIDGPQLFADGNPLDPYLRTAISSDNSRVFFNNDGQVFSIDTATDTVFQSSTGPGCCYGDYDLTLSSNQTRLEATSTLYDSNLNGESTYAANDREALNISYVYGAKLSPDGSLLFQPSTSGIDIFDGRLGNLRSRVALPFNLSANYDALVSNGKDNVLAAITGASGNGIAFIDLTSLAEPSPLPYANGALVPLSSGNRHPAAKQLAGGSSHTAHTQTVQRGPAIQHVTRPIPRM